MVSTANVIGAHAQGFNTGSVGVALLGTYSSAAPTAASQKAIQELLAWRLDSGARRPAVDDDVRLEREQPLPHGDPGLHARRLRAPGHRVSRRARVTCCTRGSARSRPRCPAIGLAEAVRAAGDGEGRQWSRPVPGPALGVALLAADGHRRARDHRGRDGGSWREGRLGVGRERLRAPGATAGRSRPTDGVGAGVAARSGRSSSPRRST